MSVFTRWMPDNPVLTKEIRVRMRGARAYWILLVYLGFAYTFLLLIYGGWMGNTHENMGRSDISTLGMNIYNIIMRIQVVMMLFITPAISSAGITLEKEQRTLDMLTMTRLPRSSIVVGKLMAAVCFTALLLITTIPIVSICFMMGGIDPVMVAGQYLGILACCFLVASMGIMWSSISKSTTAAVMFTYASIFLPLMLLSGFMSGGVLGVIGLIVMMPMGINGNMGMGGGGSFGYEILTNIAAVCSGNRLFGMSVPEGAGLAMVAVLFGLLLVAVAISRMETFPERKAPLLRGLTALTAGLVWLAADVWWIGSWYARTGNSVPPLGALTLVVMLLFIITPIFATGEVPDGVRPNARWFLSGWKPSNLKLGALPSGGPFVLLLAVMGILLFAGTMIVMGHAADLQHCGISLMGRGNVSPTHYELIAAVCAILVCVGGFAAVCALISVLFRNRWAALILAFLFMAAIWLMPLYAAAVGTQGNIFELLKNFIYLDPIRPLEELSFHKNAVWGGVTETITVSSSWFGMGVLATLGIFLLPGGLNSRRRAVKSAPVA